MIGSFNVPDPQSFILRKDTVHHTRMLQHTFGETDRMRRCYFNILAKAIVALFNLNQ